GAPIVQAALACLDTETRAIFSSEAPLPYWVPEHHFVAWAEVLWQGPCGGRFDTRFAHWSVMLTDRSFGEAVNASIGDPWVVLRRSQELWRAEHSHGELGYARLDTTSVPLT